MPQITEISWFPLKNDAKVHSSATALKDLGPELRSQPGLESSWSGAPLSMPQSVEYINVWSSSEAYETSKSNPLRARAATLLADLINTSNPAFQPYHNAVIFDEPFSTVAAAPIVQLSSVFLPKDVDTAAFEALWEGILSHVKANLPDGYVAGAHGWGIEDVGGNPQFPEGAKVFLSISGWESLEKNVAAHQRDVEKFSEVGKFSDVFEAHHTSFKSASEE